MSANPATIEHFEAEAYQASVAESDVAYSRDSAPSSFIVVALYAAITVPAMIGWLCFLVVSCWKFIRWMVS